MICPINAYLYPKVVLLVVSVVVGKGFPTKELAASLKVIFKHISPYRARDTGVEQSHAMTLMSAG